MILFNRSSALIAGNIYFFGQPEGGIEAVDWHRAEMDFGGQFAQMQARYGSEQVSAEQHDVEGGLIDPENALKEEWKRLAIGLKRGGCGYLVGNLSEGYHEGFSAVFGLLAEVTEAKLGLVGAGKEQPLVGEAEASRA